MDDRLEREFPHHVPHGGDPRRPPMALARTASAECEQFLAYVHRRLEKCPYGEAKPTCARCPIHCYKARERETARG